MKILYDPDRFGHTDHTELLQRRVIDW